MKSQSDRCMWLMPERNERESQNDCRFSITKASPERAFIQKSAAIILSQSLRMGHEGVPDPLVPEPGRFRTLTWRRQC
jgi:hypothetical protein